MDFLPTSIPACPNAAVGEIDEEVISEDNDLRRQVGPEARQDLAIIPGHVT